MRKYAKYVFLILAIAGGCAGEAVYWAFPENAGLRTLCKAVTAVGILGLAFVNGKRKDLKSRWIITALFLACLADILIVYSFPAGAGLFALAHICLIILFYKKKAISRKSWIFWAAAGAALAALILVLGSGMGIYAYGAAVYAPVLLLMVFTAAKQEKNLRIGAFMFLASDLLLALYHWKHIHPVLHIVYMGLFYAALLLFASESAERSG